MRYGKVSLGPSCVKEKTDPFNINLFSNPMYIQTIRHDITERCSTYKYTYNYNFNKSIFSVGII